MLAARPVSEAQLTWITVNEKLLVLALEYVYSVCCYHYYHYCYYYYLSQYYGIAIRCVNQHVVCLSLLHLFLYQEMESLVLLRRTTRCCIFLWESLSPGWVYLSLLWSKRLHPAHQNLKVSNVTVEKTTTTTTTITITITTATTATATTTTATTTMTLFAPLLVYTYQISLQRALVTVRASFSYPHHFHTYLF